MRIKDIQFDKDKLFFTSDTHFFHRNIIKYCDRPFETVKEMNEDLITLWNTTVPKDGLKVAIVVGFAKSGLPIIVPQDEYEEYLEDNHGYNDTPKTGFVILDK